MGWLDKISSFFRADSNQPSFEKSLVELLIKDIRRQIKLLEDQKKSLLKQEAKLNRNMSSGNEETFSEVVALQEEGGNVDEHLGILKKKLKLVEAQLDELLSPVAEKASSSTAEKKGEQ